MKGKVALAVLVFFVAAIFISGGLGLQPAAASQQPTGGHQITGSTTGSTTSSSSSTTGTTAGSGYLIWPEVTVTGTQEASGTTSYLNETSHVFRMQMAISNIPASISGQAVPNSNPQQYEDNAYTVVVGIQNAGGDPNASQTSYTLDNRTETGTSFQVTMNNKQYNAFGYTVQNGDQLTTRINGAHSQLVYGILAVTQAGDTYTINQNGSKQPVSSWNYTDYFEADLNMNRFNLGSASVDTRKTYGQPDLAGELPGDANAPANYLNFNNWIYKGGSFVGNAPFLATGDQSGTGRLQLYGTGIGYKTAIWTELSMVRFGSPNTAFSNSMQIAAYNIAPTDPNYSVPIGSATWANAWNPFASSALESEPVTLNGNSPSPPLEYLNINMQTPATGMNGALDVSVAMVDEANQVTNSFTGWQYFEDQAYQGSVPLTTLPISDGVPRLWIVDETATNTLHVNNQ